MSQPIWNNLKKTLDDDETIEQAIQRIVESHEDDPQSHIQPNQSLESHRSDNVIDHPAESVVNDKIQIGARSVNAVVDPNDPESFDNIPDAIASAKSDGGGTVYIVDGLYELDAITDIPTNVSLLGQTTENTIIKGGSDTDEYLEYSEFDGIHVSKSRIENITIDSKGGYVIKSNNADTLIDFTVQFDRVRFIGNNTYIYAYDDTMDFYRCEFRAGDDASLLTNYNLYFEKCDAYNSSGASFYRFIDRIGVGDEPGIVDIKDCHFHWEGSVSGYWFAAFGINTLRIIDTIIEGLIIDTSSPQLIMSNCRIGTDGNYIIGIGRDNSRVINNDFTLNSNNAVFLQGDATHCLLAYNIGFQFADDTDGMTNNIVNNNIEV